MKIAVFIFLCLMGHAAAPTALEKSLTGEDSSDLQKILKKDKSAKKLIATQSKYTLIALQDGSLSHIKVIAEVADLNTLRFDQGKTVLHEAVQYGSTDTVKYLLKKYPALIKVKDQQQESILFPASQRGKASIVEAVLETKDKSLCESNLQKQNPDSIAEKLGYTKTANKIKQFCSQPQAQ